METNTLNITSTNTQENFTFGTLQGTITKNGSGAVTSVSFSKVDGGLNGNIDEAGNVNVWGSKRETFQEDAILLAALIDAIYSDTDED